MSKMDDEVFEKEYNDFNNICNEAINNVIKKQDYKYFKDMIDVQKINYINDKRYQYDHIIYYYRVEFNVEKPYNNNKKTIVGFHIMPYQITQEDIRNAHIFTENRFCDVVTPTNNYVDYDNSGSGNFHKYPNEQYQLVLLNKSTKGHYGPGILSNGNKFTKENKEDYINTLIDDKVYFPNINENRTCNTIKDIEKLIEQALDEFKKIIRK